MTHVCVQFFDSWFLVNYWKSRVIAIMNFPRFQKSYRKETVTN
jgi:hypothetical protein